MKKQATKNDARKRGTRTRVNPIAVGKTLTAGSRVDKTVWPVVAAAPTVPYALGGAQVVVVAALVFLELARPARHPGFPIFSYLIASPGGPQRIALFQDPLSWLPGVHNPGLDPRLSRWGLGAALAALALLQIAALVVCMRRADAGRRDSVGAWLVGPTLSSVVLLAFPPLSSDPFSYASRGYATLVNRNPYLIPPRAVPSDPFSTFSDWNRITSPYGPLWTTMSGGLVALTHSDVVMTVLAFKVVAGLSALGLALMTYALAGRLTEDRGRRLGAMVLVAWQPIVLIETTGMAHNDAIMLLAALGGLLLLTTDKRGATRSGLLLIAASVLVKYATLPLLGLAVLWRLRPRERAAGGRLIVGRWLVDGFAVGLLAILAFAPYWSGRRTLRSLVQQESGRTSINPLWRLVKQAVGVGVASQDATRVGSQFIVVLLLFAALAGLLRAIGSTDPTKGDIVAVDRLLLRHHVRAWAIVTAAPAHLLVNSHPWYGIWAASPVALAWASGWPALRNPETSPVPGRLRSRSPRRKVPTRAPWWRPWWLPLYLAFTISIAILYYDKIAPAGAIWSWFEFDGILVNHGRGYADTGIWKTNWIVGSADPGDRADYAVEAEIRLDRPPACGSFGIVVRAQYQAGIHLCGGHPASLRAKPGDVLQEADVPVDTDWHRYRVEASGNTIRFLIDGIVVLEAVDDRYLGPGRVGLWSDRAQVTVRNFRLVELKP